MPDYAVRLTRCHDGLTVASFPDVPEALAHGRDDDEALEAASIALEAALRRRILNEQDVPEPRASGPLTIHQDVLAAVLA